MTVDIGWESFLTCVNKNQIDQQMNEFEETFYSRKICIF